MTKPKRGIDRVLKAEMGPTFPLPRLEHSFSTEESEGIINAVESRLRKESVRVGQELTDREALLIRLAVDSTLGMLDTEQTNPQGES